MLIAHKLNRTVAVWRRTQVPDGAGGRRDVWVEVGRVRTRIAQPSARERAVAQQAGAETNQVAFMLPSADVQRGDELRAGKEVFRVLAVLRPSRADYIRCDVQLVQAEGVARG